MDSAGAYELASAAVQAALGYQVDDPDLELSQAGATSLSWAKITVWIEGRLQATLSDGFLVPTTFTSIRTIRDALMADPILTGPDRG